MYMDIVFDKFVKYTASNIPDDVSEAKRRGSFDIKRVKADLEAVRNFIIHHEEERARHESHVGRR